MQLRLTELDSASLQRLLDSLWTMQDMTQRFDVSNQTIINWRTRRGLPAVSIQGHRRPALRFIPHEVRAWARQENLPMK